MKRERDRDREMGQGNAAAEDGAHVSDHESGFWLATVVENKFILSGRRFFCFEASTNFLNTSSQRKKIPEDLSKINDCF
jgi:hypothetical protein